MFAIFAAVAIMVWQGLIDLPSFWTQLAAGLVSTASVLGYLAFKTEINSWIRKETVNQPKIELEPADEKLKRENREQLKHHREALIKGYNKFIYNYYKFEHVTLEEYLSFFEYWKQFRQHLYTGHRELYDLIGQNDYDLFIERMREDLLDGIVLKTQEFGGACNDCLNLHDEKNIPQLKLMLSQL
jgi:uncharacterized short protein YbdD (DUF466 family)